MSHQTFTSLNDMKKITLSLLCVLIAVFAQAQTISGRLLDGEHKPVEYAAVLLQTTDSVYVDVAYSDTLGYFGFETSMDNYRLYVQHLMYTPFSKEFSTPDCGELVLESKDFGLDEVVIKGERPLVKVVDGRMTYDMPQLLHNKMASNAYDAILELPGVYEQNDAINLAGSNGVNIIINGKPTTMTADQLIVLLKSMPKERIQSAEVMYTAPPQFHIRGAAINLVLTNGLSEDPQLKGQVNGTYDQYHYANYQGGLTLMYSTPKSSTDFMYQFSYNKNRSGLDLNSHHLLNGTVYDIEQHNRGYGLYPLHNIRLGHDYHFNEDNKLSITYTSQIRAWSRAKETSNGTFSDSENRKEADSPVQMHNLALDYTSGFGLTAGMDYTFYKSHTTQYYNEMITGKENTFNAKSRQNIHRFSVYADQSHDLGKNWILDYGTRFSFASDKSSQEYFSAANIDLSGSNTSSDANEYTYELYAGFSKQFTEKLSLKAYLTGEYYKYKSADYWSAFPEMELTYVINPSHILQYAVASDKSYPNYWEMINTISYINGYAELHGNPDLRPSRSYDMQLSYILKSKYIFTLYGSYQDDYFVQLPYQSPEHLTLIYKTTNFDYKSKIGLNAVIPFSIGSIVNSRLTLNGFYDKVKSSNFHDISFVNDNFSYIAMLHNTFNISDKPNIKAELSGVYTPKNIQGPSTLSEMYRVDAGVKWVSENNKAEIRLKVNDAFNTWSPKEWKMNVANQNLNQHVIPDSRSVSLSFTYKFGGYKENSHKEVDTSRFGSK